MESDAYRLTICWEFERGESRIARREFTAGQNNTRRCRLPAHTGDERSFPSGWTARHTDRAPGGRSPIAARIEDKPAGRLNGAPYPHLLNSTLLGVMYFFPSFSETLPVTVPSLAAWQNSL